MLDKIIDKFVAIVLTYPSENIQGLFNRYMHTLSESEIMEIGNFFPLVLRAGEAARNTIPEMQQMILSDIRSGSMSRQKN